MKDFFHTLLGFTPFWDYKSTNANHAVSPGVYSSDKVSNLKTIQKIHLKFDIKNGSIQDGLRQPILFSFVLDKPSGYKIFSEPETIHSKKINKSVSNTITFYLEDSNTNGVILTEKRWHLLYQWLKLNITCLHTFVFVCVKNDLQKIWKE